MLEPRIYRAALVPAALAVLVLMFSLEAPPAPLPPEPAADVLFEGRSGAVEASAIATRDPDRRAGSAGDRASAEAVAAALAARGFDVTSDPFTAGKRRLVNVLARRTGSSRRQIVVMAARDATSVPDTGGSAADTAALLEVARVLEGRASEKTLVLASVDGSALGDAGARRFADTEPDLDQVDAVVVLSNLGAPATDAPPLVAWSSDASRGSLGLERTAAASLADGPVSLEVADGALSQVVRMAAPLGLGAQGPLLARDVGAIRVSGSGELPPGAQASLDAERYGELGRAALRIVAALDAGGPPEHGPAAYVVAAGQVVPGWALSTLALALILAPLAAGADALARARRRREPVAAWMGWVLAGGLAFVASLLAAEVLALAGLAPTPMRWPVPPALSAPGTPLVPTLVLCAVVLALAWRSARPWLARRAAPGRLLNDPTAPGAGVAAALVSVLAVLALWAANPFAGLLLAPLANAVALAALSGARARTGTVLLLAGLAAPVAGAVLYLGWLSLDPLAGAGYALGLVTGGHVHMATLLLGCVLLGGLGSTAAILLARARRLPASAVLAHRPRRSGGWTLVLCSAPTRLPIHLTMDRSTSPPPNGVGGESAMPHA